MMNRSREGGGADETLVTPRRHVTSRYGYSAS